MAYLILIIALGTAAIGSALVAGTFFAFSTFVMASLSKLPAEQGIAAMQSINITILRSPFIALFMLTAILSVVIAIMAILHWRGAASAAMLAGAALYLLASFLSTIVFNVPLNDALAAADARTPAAAELWTHYLSDWTWWNHVRTAASLLASIAFVRGLMV
jgi:uncharacterized membrane protein